MKILKTLAGDLFPLKSRQFVYREAAVLLGVGQEDLNLFRNEEILPEDHSEIQASEVLCVLIEPFPYKVKFDYAIWRRGVDRAAEVL